MDKQDVRVEILMAVHNGAAFLPEQIDSILRQSDDRWHLTISDDGSEDASPEIIGEYARQWPEKITVHRSGQRFGSARDHFFYLMARCEAGYMLFCDQDDVWYPDKVKKTRAALVKAEADFGADTPILAFSDQTPTDAALKPLADSLMRYQKQYFEHFDYRSILMQNVVTGGAMGINRALAKLAAPWGDASRGDGSRSDGSRGDGSRGNAPSIIMHDWWLAATAARFGRIVYIDEPLGAYRQHGKNAVGAKDVGSAGYFVRKLGTLREVRRTILQKKAQAAAFRQSYVSMLSEEDFSFLNKFSRSRSGLAFYLKYMRLIHGAQRRIGLSLLG